jgi:hypothetical protein
MVVAPWSVVALAALLQRQVQLLRQHNFTLHMPMRCSAPNSDAIATSNRIIVATHTQLTSQLPLLLLLLLLLRPHRCSDKSAVVRARALSDLAEVVDCFASLLAEDPASEQHQVAEAFVEGLGAAAALQVSG